jgi:hypothetical protein
MGAVNLSNNAQGQSGQFNLVLLVQDSVLENAPTINSLSALKTNADPAAHDYWSQYVMLGPGGGQ